MLKGFEDKQETKIHWPTLNTVLMVENVLKKVDNSIISVAELKRRLPKQVNHNTLVLILKYLEEGSKILVTMDGVTWVHSSHPKLKRYFNENIEL